MLKAKIEIIEKLLNHFYVAQSRKLKNIDINYIKEPLVNLVKCNTRTYHLH